MYCILLCVPRIGNGIFLGHGGIIILLPGARRRYGYMVFLLPILLPSVNSESSVIQQPVRCRWRGAWLLVQFEKCSPVDSIGCRVLLKTVGLFVRWRLGWPAGLIRRVYSTRYLPIDGLHQRTEDGEASTDDSNADFDV